MLKRLLLLLVSILTLQSLKAENPKLVVGIVVDQMRYDYIQKYWDKFGKGGFKKLVKNGYFYRNTQYNYVPTFTGPGHASIYTGTTPSIHGIIANEWIYQADPKKWNDKTKSIYCVQDDGEGIKNVGGDSASGKMSPKNLLTSTIGDELKLFTNGKSKVIGIALKDRGSILPAGHGANAAYWLSDNGQGWMTSSYYTNQLPKWVSDFNSKKYEDEYLNHPWNTLLDISKYTESEKDYSDAEGPFNGEDINGENKPFFPHNLPYLKDKNRNLIRRTPFGNTLTKDFAESAIEAEQLGKGEQTDMLCVSFSSTDYVGHQFGVNSIEVEDTYLRLDKDLEDLIQYLEKNIGKENLLLFLTADHGAAYAQVNYMKYRIPTGGILKREDLKLPLEKELKSYFGEADQHYIIDISDGQIYLNHRQLIAKNIPIEKVNDVIKNHLMTVKGIQSVMFKNDIMKRTSTDKIEKMIENGFNDRLSGDIVICYQPGYMEYHETGSSHGSPFIYDTHVPLIWYGGSIKHGESYDEVNITDIAPTVCAFLKINAPNGSIGKVLGIVK